jgi:hypothetical protein
LAGSFRERCLHVVDADGDGSVCATEVVGAAVGVVGALKFDFFALEPKK